MFHIVLLVKSFKSPWHYFCGFNHHEIHIFAGQTLIFIIFYRWRVQIYHLSSHILISKPGITKKWDFLVRPQGSDDSAVVLKPHLQSVLINVARGGVCDQPALAELLSQRRFRAGRAAWVVHVAPSCGFSPGNLLDQRHLDSLGLICSGFLCELLIPSGND